MSDDVVMGYWVKTKSRCQYCHRPTESLYVVREGPCTGSFCGRGHYELARQQMEKNETNN